jgi:hypothetical protein
MASTAFGFFPAPGHAEHGDRKPALRKQPVQPPEPGPAAIFIEAFHRHGAIRMARRAHHVGQEPLGQFIAIEHGVFRASS